MSLRRQVGSRDNETFPACSKPSAQLVLDQAGSHWYQSTKYMSWILWATFSQALFLQYGHPESCSHIGFGKCGKTFRRARSWLFPNLGLLTWGIRAPPVLPCKFWGWEHCFLRLRLNVVEFQLPSQTMHRLQSSDVWSPRISSHKHVRNILLEWLYLYSRTGWCCQLCLALDETLVPRECARARGQGKLFELDFFTNMHDAPMATGRLC